MSKCTTGEKDKTGINTYKFFNVLDRMSDEMETFLSNQSSNADNQRFLISHRNRKTKSLLNKFFAYPLPFSFAGFKNTNTK